MLDDDPFVNENTSDRKVQLDESLIATNLGTSSSESDREDISVFEMLNLAKKQ